MSYLIREEMPIARKDYSDDAIYWIYESGFYPDELTAEENEQVDQARENNYTIKKGTEYLKITYNDGGELITFRAIPELNDICLKYDLYED